MPLIALTGGIASGKSTIAHRLAWHGAVVVDADAVVRKVQQPGSPVLAQIAERFGADVIRTDGTLDRAGLAGRVFGDATRVAQLNAIVHPAVRSRSQQLFEDAARADPDAVIVYDVPLLVEARLDDAWDLIVVADAPRAVREQRLVSRRGMSADEARARMDAQADDARRREIADVVIDTSGALSHTIAQTDALWHRLQEGIAAPAAT